MEQVHKNMKSEEGKKTKIGGFPAHSMPDLEPKTKADEPETPKEDEKKED